MKLLLILITAFSAVFLHAAAPPAPAMIGQVGAPTNGFWLTNITFVWTNAAVRTPTIDLAAVTVYGTNAIKGATALAWSHPTNAAGIAGYRLYYGTVGGTTTNKFQVSSNVSCALFYSSLATNSTWWAYATSLDTTLTNESVPSASIVFHP